MDIGNQQRVIVVQAMDIDEAIAVNGPAMDPDRVGDVLAIESAEDPSEAPILPTD